MQTILVLGASGMLGSMVADVLARDENLQVIATTRSAEYARLAAERVPNIEWKLFEIGPEANMLDRLRKLGPVDWVVNAIGLTKPYTHDENAAEVEQAIRGNAVFPYQLAHVVQEYNGHILQIATDCVYSGTTGHYAESSRHDALDVYGKTKSLGEALLPNIHHLRCSIIGPEPKAYVFLLAWFLRQARNAKVNGYTNHRWNGVTTLHFAKICHGIIDNHPPLSSTQHVLPTGEITKYDLLCSFAHAFNRHDITISPTEAPLVIDRTLATENPALNLELWKYAGYVDRPPTVPEMVEELAKFNYRFADMNL